MAINSVWTRDGSDESLRFQPMERLKVYLFGATVLFASFGMGEAVYRLLFSEFDGMTDRIPVEALFGLVFAWLASHQMGKGLADGITQGGAGPDEFRTAPLWGVGQRVFFLHDGRTSNLVDAIRAHQSHGSEANKVIEHFNRLTVQEQQEIIDFLRSL
jgi:hypothetical protein